MTDITKLYELKENYNNIMDKISSLHAEASEVKTKLDSLCTHPTTIKKQQHYPGGYFDTAETRYWDECTICGKKMNFNSKRGGYG